MPSDIVKEDIRDAWRRYTEVPTPPRAKVVIDYVPDLLDELDVKDERIQELNDLTEELAQHRENLEQELKLANASLQDVQRGRQPEPEVAQDYQELLEVHRRAFLAGIGEQSPNQDVHDCVAAIPPLLAENARLRQDSEVLRKLLEAASLFSGMLKESTR